MEIIKGYCCHSKEVCSWPSFLSLLSKVNRLNRTARITKRGASLAWIHPPKKKKILVVLLRFPRALNFQDCCLGKDLLLKTLQFFVCFLLLTQWQQEMRPAAPADSEHNPAAAGTGTLKCWSPPGTQGGCRAAEPSTVTPQTAFPGMSPCMASQGPGSTTVPLSGAPQLLHSALQ